MSVALDSNLVESLYASVSLPSGSTVTQRPMSSYARIEGGAQSTHKVANFGSIIPRKTFLPQLLPSKGDPSALLFDKEDTESDMYKQKMWTGQANILVTVRLRPLLSHDRDRREIVKALGNHEVVVLVRSPESLRRNSRGKRRLASLSSSGNGPRSHEKRYAFDHVFTPRDGQQTVYEHTTKFLVHGVLNGFNATVFAYGCTGAGKTYTMLGTRDEPGIMARTLDDLFQSIERTQADPGLGVQYRVTVSFLEVYNENIRDLLSASSSCSSSPSMPSSEFLDLREDPVRGSIIAGLSEVEATNAREVMKLLRKGNRYRSQESTAANSVSSRSHAVLQVYVKQQRKLTSGEKGLLVDDAGPRCDEDLLNNVEVKIGKLSLVDLAGSERAAVTQNRGQRLLEGANINRSLLALGNCINALGKKGTVAGRSFVPYRDSKLTRLLKDSLGGNCRTVMIANVGLAISSVEETLNTLKYANRAKSIKTTVMKNIVEADASIETQNELVATLRNEIATLKQALLQQQFSSQASPARPKSLWVDSVNGMMNKNSDDEGNHSFKLHEARQYIIESFQERRLLRHALLKVEHQVRLRVQELLLSRNEQALTTLSAVATSKNVENLSQDEATAVVADNAVIKTSDDLSLALLTRERESLQQELTRNERAMDELRMEIEQTSGMNKFVREILLMEYRIGNLEIDKMQLQTMRDLDLNVKDHKDDNGAFNTECSNVGKIGDLMSKQKCLQENNDLPALDSASLLVPMSLQNSDCRVQLPKILPNKMNGRGTFLEELREHFSSTKSTNYRSNRNQVMQKVVASPGNYHKNWGLNNVALPSIRLKKKISAPLSMEPTTSGKSAISSGKAPLATPVAAPYLKLLKSRRRRSIASTKPKLK